MKKISLILSILTMLFFGFSSNIFAEELYSNVKFSPQTNTTNNVKLNIGKCSSTLIKPDNSLWVWGYDPFIDNNSVTPTKEADNVSECLMEGRFYAMLKTDGSLYLWGDNQFGQIGNGVVIEHGDRGPNTYDGDYNIPYIEEPFKVLDNVKQVAIGDRHVLALKNDGTLYSWGDQSYGSLGNGADTSRSNLPISTPTKVMDNVTQIAAGGFNSAALKSDGSLYMFGQNRYGSCGNGIASPISTPTKILDNVKQVSLGEYHSAAVKKDGTLYMWGYNNKNRLGLSTQEYEVKTPTEVMDSVSYVSLGTYHSGAIKNDNSLWMWGYNDHGGIGNNSTEAPSTPVKIMDNVAQLSLGFGHTAALKKDNSLWTWGHNGNGQLGNGVYGPNEHSYIPIEILKDINSSGEPTKPDNPEPDEPSKPDTPTNPDQPASNVVIYRLNNDATGEHLYTSNKEEYNILIRDHGWKGENIAWTAPSTGEPVYRLYNSGIDSHLYTKDSNEFKTLTEERGWGADNGGQPLFYSNGSVPVYRLYNEGVKRHLLTTDRNEYDTLKNQGWTQEGIAFYCISK